MAADKTLACRDCGTEYMFTAGEQDFYAQKGFSEPTRCPACRAQRKMERMRLQADDGGAPASFGEGGGGGRGGRGGSREHDRDRRDRSQRDRW